MLFGRSPYDPGSWAEGAREYPEAVVAGAATLAATALILSLTISPYVQSYDDIVLIPAVFFILWLVERAAATPADRLRGSDRGRDRLPLARYRPAGDHSDAGRERGAAAALRAGARSRRVCRDGAGTLSRTLRIAIFHLGFFYSGGGEKLVLEQARELRARDHSVAVYAPVVDMAACFPDLMAEVQPQALLRRMPDLFGVGDALTLLASSFVAGYLTRDIDADVYLGANQPGAWLAHAAAHAHRKRYVVYLSQPNRLLLPRAIDRSPDAIVVRRDYFLLALAALLGRPLLDRADRKSVGGAAVRLGDGPYITTILRFYYGGAWRNCPAAVRPAGSRPADLHLRPSRSIRINGIQIDGPIVLLTNRHYPQKRFEWMFPVIERVRRDHQGATLVITGAETVYTAWLREEVRRRALDSAVKFLGHVSESDLTELYRAATVYVYPSPEEDFGLGIVEAMGHGTPVVAWDNAGPAGIIEDDRSGRLIQLDDHAGFAEAVAAIVRDDELRIRLGVGGWDRVRERFSFARHVDVLEAALQEAAAYHP